MKRAPFFNRSESIRIDPGSPMSEETHYALFIVDESGVEWFAGTYKTRDSAEAKGAASGKAYEVRLAILDA